MNEKYIQDTLNPAIWSEDKLKESVRLKLIQIKNKFVDGLVENNIPFKLHDVQIVGSNASFNYGEHSDIDLHIIVDMDNIENKDLVRMIYTYYKSNFNKKYNISVKGINVELYIEDKEQPAKSNGIFSLLQNKWIKYPANIEEPDVDITNVFDYMLEKYNEIVALNNIQAADTFLNTLYANRQRSLAIDGEFGVDNLVFKEFRNRGYLDVLKQIITDGESYELSLESLQERLIKENEEVKDTHNIDYYYDNRIQSKFDKWLGYDCGPIRHENKYYDCEQYEGIWEESWIFVGRQEDKKYYFYLNGTDYSHRDLIGSVLKFDTFREATYMIAFPGRGY